MRQGVAKGMVCQTRAVAAAHIPIPISCTALKSEVRVKALRQGWYIL